MKSMILSAGFGTRLRPLTLEVPKPLLPLNDRPLVFYQIELLKKYGFQEILMNLHYRAFQIEEVLGDGRKFGVKIHYSREEEILGTGGGIRQAAQIFPDEPLLVINCDILIDLDLKELVRFHQAKKGIATMVLRLREADCSAIEVDKNWRIQKITRNPKSGKYMYTGVQILEPEFIQSLPKGNSCLIQQGYMPLLQAKKPVYGLFYDGYWNDVGTMERYQQEKKDLGPKN